MGQRPTASQRHPTRIRACGVPAGCPRDAQTAGGNGWETRGWLCLGVVPAGVTVSTSAGVMLARENPV